MSKTRIIGIDFGLKRIGMSLSDETHLIAAPLKNVIAEKKSELTVTKVVATIEQIKKDYSATIETIVVGMPLKLDGSTSFLTDEVKHFVELLEKEVDCPVIIWDERLTTVQAERALREASMSRKKRMKVVDSICAVIILQNYLDKLSIEKERLLHEQ